MKSPPAPMAEPSPFEDDPILNASLSAAPIAMGAPAPSQRGGQSSIVPESSPVASGDLLSDLGGGGEQPAVVLGGGADTKSNKADSKKPAEAEVPKGPTPYSVWEGKRMQILAERQAKADEAKRASVTQAKEEVAKFYALRTERIASNKQQNRLDEKSTKAEIATLFQFGAQWEKVGKLINIAPKANEKRTVDRMRKLLLTLKNDNGAAAGVKSPAADSKASK